MDLKLELYPPGVDGEFYFFSLIKSKNVTALQTSFPNVHKKAQMPDFYLCIFFVYGFSSERKKNINLEETKEKRHEIRITWQKNEAPMTERQEKRECGLQTRAWNERSRFS